LKDEFETLKQEQIYLSESNNILRAEIVKLGDMLDEFKVDTKIDYMKNIVAVKRQAENNLVTMT